MLPLPGNNQERKGHPSSYLKESVPVQEFIVLESLCRERKGPEGSLPGKDKLSPWPSGKSEDEETLQTLHPGISLLEDGGVCGGHATLENETY